MPKTNRKGFDSLITLVSWTLWKYRNDRVFGRQQGNPNVLELTSGIFAELKLWAMAGGRWVASFLE